MQDDIKSEESHPEDDLDLPGELADDSWDDFEEDAAATDVPADGDAPITAPRKKTFVARNFNLIVAAVMVIAVGGYAGMRMLSLSSTSKNPSAMPSYDGGGATAPETAASTPAPFSPPPAKDGIVELKDNAATPPPMPTPTPDEPATGATDQASGLTPLPAPQEASHAKLPDLGDAAAPMPSHTTTEPAPIPTPAGLQAPPAAPTPVKIVSQEPLEPAPTPPATAVAATPSAPDPAAAAKMAQLQKDMHAMKDQMAGELEDAHKKIDSLTQTIALLQKKLDAAQAKQAESISEPTAPPAENYRPAAPPPVRAPENQPQAKQEIKREIKKPALPKKTAASILSEAPVQKPAPEPDQTIAPAAATSTPWAQKAPTTVSTGWDLRSAQPGRAVVAPKNSNDLKSVAVGDTLAGIGRITTIGLENGVWTIQGTKGVIRR